MSKIIRPLQQNAGFINREMKMDWQELNCIIEALEALIDKYASELTSTSLDEDDHSEITNDKAYAEILLSTYQQKKGEFTDH